MHFSPLIPWHWLAVLVACAICLVIADYIKLTRSHRRKACQFVVLMRFVMLATAFIVLVPLRVTRKTPQLDKLKSVVAVDVSQSMETLIDGKSRRQITEELLNHKLSKEYMARSRTEYSSFSNVTKPLLESADGTFKLTPSAGNTKIGTMLEDVLKLSDKGTPLASLLLFTDGRSIDGPNPIELAKQFKAKAIPISCVILPGETKSDDVKIEVTTPSVKVVKGMPFHVDARITAYGKTFDDLTVQLLMDQNVLQTQTVTVKPGEPVSVSLPASIPMAGLHTLSVRIKSDQPDARPDNNVDFISVEVAEPPTFSILYLAYGVDWEWRFFSIHTQENEQFKTSAIIQTGKETFFVHNMPVEFHNNPKYPDKPEQLDDFDVIIANAELFKNLSEDQLKAIRAFVEYKGGGLVIRGLNAALPETIQPLLPAKSFIDIPISRPRKLHFMEDLVFTQDTAKQLNPQQGAWIQPVDTAAVVQEPHHGTRSVATIDSQEGPAFLAVHAFGAGRVARLGLQGTWKWAMADDATAKMYSAFWNQLVVWLAQATKPRLQLHGNGARIHAGEPHEFKADVLGNDFRPSPDAKLSAVVTEPDGTVIQAQFLPDMDELGRYVLDILPTKMGEYKLNVTAAFKEHTLTKHARFLAVPDSRELDDTTTNKPLLMDMARLTGGTTFTPEQFLDNYANIPLSPNVPMMEKTIDVLPDWLRYALFLFTATIAWWARRRLGLK